MESDTNLAHTVSVIFTSFPTTYRSLTDNFVIPAPRQWPEVGGQRSEVTGRKSEVGSQGSGVRNQQSEIRGQEPEVFRISNYGFRVCLRMGVSRRLRETTFRNH